jgi:hypothetical protein
MKADGEKAVADLKILWFLQRVPPFFALLTLVLA